MDQAPAQTEVKPQVVTPRGFRLPNLKIILAVLIVLVLVLVGFNLALDKYGRFWEKKVGPKPTPVSKITPTPSAKKTSPSFKGTVESVNENSFRVKNDQGETKEFIVNEKTTYFTKGTTPEAKAQKIEKGDLNSLKIDGTVTVAFKEGEEGANGKILAVSILIISP